MKTGMLVLILLLPLLQAFTPVKSGAYITASNVAKNVDIQCSGISGVDANGDPQAVVTDCIIRLAVLENNSVMNFCYRFASYDLFNAVFNKTLSLHDLGDNTKSTNWSWAPALQPVPDGIDARCLQ